MNGSMPPTKNKPINFEAALTELETLVDAMEQGGLSLEDSLKKFERGISLTRDCQSALKDAEQKVKILLEKNQSLVLEDFEDEKDNDESDD